jgi:SWI/SNF-related matrix-associated actin-dependent regulator of chromatin subfamily A-like protein 1
MRHHKVTTRSEKLKTPKRSTVASLGLLPHQREALSRARKRLENHRAVYLALDPGLGKTILALKLMKCYGVNRVYIVPAGLKANVEAEIEKWGVKGVSLISDTQLDSYWPPEVIDCLVIDEAQRFSNPKSGRSVLMYRLAQRAAKVVLLSGTPAPNARPVELWPVLEAFAPELFKMKFFEFAKKYCAATKTPFGWKFSGFSNKQEFKERLYKSFMIRMKKDRLKLPEKREGILTVGDGIPAIVSKLEKALIKAHEKDLLEGRILEESGVNAMHLSEYLKALGVYKLKYVYPHIDRILLDTDEKLLIFAQHKEVIDGLRTHLVQFNPIVITGSTPIKNRKPLVDAFQKDPKRRVAILNIIAGGIGWTLTEADRVLMVEFSWRDGDNTQASDRANRIGSTKPVLVQYVVLKDSYDAKRLGVVLNKRQHAV